MGALYMDNEGRGAPAATGQLLYCHPAYQRAQGWVSASQRLCVICWVARLSAGRLYILSVCLSVRLSVSVSLLPARLLYSTVPLQLYLPICLPFAKLLISPP